MQKLHKQKLAIIGTVGVPARYGGFETLAEQLVLQMREEYDITVFNSTEAYPKGQRPATWEGAKLVYLPLKANGFQSIMYDIISMMYALLFSDVLLVDNNGTISVGSDVKATVKAEIISALVQGEKVIAFKMKRRKGFRKKHGHRTHYTKIKVTGIA